jgi:hypothetical protein
MGDLQQERSDIVMTNSSAIEETVKAQGDTVERYRMDASGKMSWGSGSASPDVTLERTGAGVLSVSTGSLQGSQPLVNVTAASVTLSAATHGGAITTLNRAAGMAITLPPATGSGVAFTLIVGTTFTAAASIAVADGTDYMVGTASLGIDGGTAVPHQYPTANTATLATESDTLSLFGTANSQGGFKGQIVELIDIATDIWFVRTTGDAGGTEATPFSAAV